jgi:hypothetical protein
MTKSRSVVITILVLVAIALPVAAFFFLFEPVEEEIDTGYSKQARQNQFLAAQRFLRELGVASATIRGMDKVNNLPAQHNVLFATYSHRFEQSVTREHLLAWIKQGGHLILELRPYIGRDDVKVETPLLDTLEVWPANRDVFFNKINTETIEVRVYKNSEPLTVAFQPFWTLKVNREDPVLLFNDSNGIHLVEYNLGDGVITIMSGFDLWRNRNIGRYDHAAALAQILGDNPGKVWFLQGVSMPSLFELMWQYGLEAVVASAVLLLLILWYLNNRFGPVVAINQRQRRSLLEHLDAVGQFDWRYQHAEGILKTVRSDLHQMIETRYPRWQKKSATEQTEWLAQRTRLPELEISQALTASPDHQTNFTRYIRVLQIIRKTV